MRLGRKNRRFRKSHARRRRVGRRLEPLEPRRLLVGDPVITEFVASNDDTLDDGDGNASDWIEIFNAGDAPVDLAGWYLTDDSDDLTQWEFPDIPSMELPVGQFLLVFASGSAMDDYVDLGGNPHTNFKLDAGGEYLAIVEPDGQTVAHDFSPTFPSQRGDISYGLAMTGRPVTSLANGGFETNNGVFFDPTVDAWEEHESYMGSGPNGNGGGISGTAHPSRLPWGFNIMPILGRYARTQLICPMLGLLTLGRGTR